MSAASAVSMGLDPEVRTLLRAGDYPGALNHSSYHLPFVGAGRNSWDAWQTGHPWQAAGHAGLLGVEAFGLRGIGKLPGAGKVRGTVLKGGVAKGTAKAAKVVREQSLQQVLPNTETFLKSAETVWKQDKQGPLSVAGRALQKHAGRAKSSFSHIKFSGKTANQDAMRVIKEILNSNNQVVEQGLRGGYEIYDATTRRGFSISRNGLFNGFRNYKGK